MRNSWGNSWGNSWKTSWGFWETVRRKLVRIAKMPIKYLSFPRFRK